MAAISGIDLCLLRFIGIVDHAVFSVCHIGVDFDMVVGGKPAVEVLFISRTPQNRPVKQSVVFKGERQPADVDRAPCAKFMYRKINVISRLRQDLCPVKRIDILLSLAKINVCACVFGDKMRVYVFVVFVISKRKSAFLLHAKHIGKLEEMTVCLMRGRLSDSDESAPAMNKFFDGRGNDRVTPPFPAGLRGVRIPDI